MLLLALSLYCDWQCVLEIFIFLRMGGGAERVQVHLLANPGQDQAEARAELMASFAKFDAAKVSRRCKSGAIRTTLIMLRGCR